jgi:hypothetical protein
MSLGTSKPKDLDIVWKFDLYLPMLSPLNFKFSACGKAYLLWKSYQITPVSIGMKKGDYKIVKETYPLNGYDSIC